MALYDPSIAEALGLDPATLLTKEGFAAFMERVYQVVTPLEIEGAINALDHVNKIPFVNLDTSKLPTSLGLWPVGIMAAKTVEFASQNGADIKPVSVTNGDIRGGKIVLDRIGYDQGKSFIMNAIANGYPVALLNTFNPTPITNVSGSSTTETKQHWVTITGSELTGNDMILTISSWGGEYTMSYNDLYDSWQDLSAIGSGMVYFIQR